MSPLNFLVLSSCLLGVAVSENPSQKGSVGVKTLAKKDVAVDLATSPSHGLGYGLAYPSYNYGHHGPKGYGSYYGSGYGKTYLVPVYNYGGHGYGGLGYGDVGYGNLGHYSKGYSGYPSYGYSGLGLGGHYPSYSYYNGHHGLETYYDGHNGHYGGYY